ncbi:MetQ/NlpA family ABC transporter substrate-binding protein [Aureimonas mangrovi]|uniref:MetQ/NlpA family ABC transporter substrate-binding protein n=1 Tax=Aureimonas mangrovi TaxID=2758041 RepID=UPI00163DB037|nr:MetQ/NlpA family ABC transporter substrate-binding protein [Aureimonas mangrovi]
MRSLLLATAIAGAAALPANAQTTIRIGVTPGPHAQIMEKVKEILDEGGEIDLDIVEFSDYVVPNQALADGDLDANSFQHQPYLDNQVADRGYDLVSVAQTVNYPMGVYSEKIASIDELQDGASIAVPNDPTNGARGLLLLEALGVIGIDDEVGLRATPLDITDNEKNIRIVELDAAQLPRSLADVDAATINTNYALEAGLDPQGDAIAREEAQSPYVNVIAVRGEDAEAAWVQPLIAAYHSDEVKAFVDETFQGSVITAW